MTVCGWLPKDELDEKAKFFKKGTKRYRSDKTWFRTKADLYELPNKKLRTAKTPKDLKEQLKEYALLIRSNV